MSGQFMLDSEARLSEALEEGHVHGQHRHESPETNENQQLQTAAESETGTHDVYTCPMEEHFHVLQYGEGRCSECGMKLVPVDKTENQNVFVCPMHECEVVQSDAGDCPKCGMHLIKLSRESDDDQQAH